jgi:NADPH:quinone reductase-like Zn-dependent oxidoreductase
MVDSGGLKISVKQALPLEKGAMAHRLIEKGGMIGKLVLTTKWNESHD